MSNLLYTVQNLVDDVRSQLDEQDQDAISTTADILPVLNRAQDYAFDVYSRKYVEPILTYQPLALTNGTQEYPIPENVFEDRILKVEITVPAGNGLGSSQREVQRISFRDISNYESASKTNIPYYYCIIGRKIRFVPNPTGTYPVRLWYLRNPEKLVLPQGRITIVNPTSNYVIVDSAGDALTTESDQLGSYVNVVDGQTGEIKGSLQIQILTDNKVTFRTVPTRTSVLNRTMSTDLVSINVEQDDYLAPIDGTCVPYYGRPTSNFLIQYTISELVRKLGGAADLEEKVLDKFEQQVARTFVKREEMYRIQKRNQSWGVPTRRWYYE